MKKEKIACVVVTYNPDGGFKESFASLKEQVGRMIIVDNGSNKEAIKMLENIASNNSDTELILNKDNLGIATALNIGVKSAKKQNFQWVITMDQDSKAAPDMVKIMMSTYEGLGEKEKEEVLSIFPNFVDESVQSIEENSTGEEYQYVDADITSGNLVRMDVFDKVGYFDDTLFIDLVDTDFCMKLNLANIKMIKVNKAILFHQLGEGKRVKTLIGGFNTSNHSALRRYYMTRNRFYTWEKYKELNSFTLNRDKKLFVKEFAKVILGEEDRINKVKMIVKGYCHYKKGIRGKL